ncbi:MAG: cytochrome P460 family protein [Chitinophagaceae bacterium]|nr:cytochrome P460 family protein [Rubrivivax sp.]
MPRKSMLKWTLAAAGVAAAALVVAQTAPPLVPPGPNKLQFPADWATQMMYATVDRPDTKQYREFYGPEASVKAARAGQPIPDGTVLTLAAYAAKLDAEGKPLKDANGRFIKDKLLVVNSMQKKAGFGADIHESVRNGDWIYQSFTPDGKVNDKANLTACYQCHLPFAKDDYLTNLAKLQGKFPTVAKAVAQAGPQEVAISNFTFGPGTIKVAAGQKVTWLNADDSPHQVTLEAGSQARTALMLKGQTATLQFDEAGNIAYRCGLHPTMKGVIEVAPKS